MNFTDEQLRVIDTRNCNLLVSAAAGSGKTAVLVERIIRIVSDLEKKIDIDSLLVMTFTRAAAAQMKDRLSKKLIECMKEAAEEGNSKLLSHLKRQSVLIRGAQINTIDGFCSSILKNHFGKIGLDPSFRVATEGELKLIKADILKEIIENAYEGGGEFFDFIETYSISKGDGDIEDAIMQLYDYSQASPEPVSWLMQAADNYEAKSFDELIENDMVRKLYNSVSYKLNAICLSYENMLKLCNQPDGPYMYADMLEKEKKFVEGALKIAKMLSDGSVINGKKPGKYSFTEWYDKLKLELSNPDFGRMSAKKDDSVNGDKRELVKSLRAKAKDNITKLSERYFINSPEHVMSTLEGAGNNVKIIARLAIEFLEHFKERKKELSIVDFSDLEHMAIDVLYDTKEDGSTVPSAVADEYREQFEEIMIDEYQDSNEVQEVIVNAIARKTDGNCNVFMVGDVKQSIYRFRLAMPQLFMGKRSSYAVKTADDECAGCNNVRIDLHRNFRSRSQVIDTANYIFERIMIPEVGGVEYDEDARLVCGADGYDQSEPDKYKSELILIKQSEDMAKMELEGHAIAQRIRLLMKEMTVDDGNGGQRSLEYRDIAILIRATGGWETAFRDALLANGIPSSVDSKIGYFDSYEVRHVLAYLELVNNIRNDELLCEVLKGPFCDFSDEELAMIRIAYRKCSFYEAAMRYGGVYRELTAKVSADDEDLSDEMTVSDEEIVAEVIDDELAKKLAAFFETLSVYSEKAAYLSVHELITLIIRRFSFDHIVLAMDNGKQRLMNLNMLYQKATEYESTSYKGLFNFIRYINQLKKYEVDFGQANVNSEADDAVRIMTIHKSKGLEFPVCFVSALGKGFNKAAVRDKIVTDNKEGVGIDYIDKLTHIKRPCVIKQAINEKLEHEEMGEELRVLYVALTRAKEKLIMTGVLKESRLEEYMSSEDDEANTAITAEDIMGSSSYLDWIMQSVKYVNNSSPIDIRLVDEYDMIVTETGNTLTRDARREEYFEFYKNGVNKAEMPEFLKVFDWKYPYNEINVRSKYSVSDLKHSDEDEKRYSADFVAEERKEASGSGHDSDEKVPFFISGDKAVKPKLIGSMRGTAYHRFFELIDYTRPLDADDIQAQLEEATRKGQMDSDFAGCIEIADYLAFLKTDAAKRMKAAALCSKLYREQPFCFAVSASQIDESYPDSEEVIIQGIIDVLFMEDDEYVILDYKTDKVKALDELKEKYHRQLEYYAMAIEQITGKRVKECIIYSVTLGKEVSL